MASVVSGVLRALSASCSGVFSNFFARHPLIVTRKASDAKTAAKAPEASNTKCLVRTKHDNDTMNKYQSYEAVPGQVDVDSNFPVFQG